MKHSFNTDLVYTEIIDINEVELMISLIIL